MKAVRIYGAACREYGRAMRDESMDLPQAGAKCDAAYNRVIGLAYSVR